MFFPAMFIKNSHAYSLLLAGHRNLPLAVIFGSRTFDFFDLDKNRFQPTDFAFWKSY
jgi:hypothetical protein